MTNRSLLSFYQDNEFNPVPIALDSQSAWESQLAKRRNLYERQLGIPFLLLNNQSVLEFGCNSGENALVLAAQGANLTLVDPNDQVLPRLRELFHRYNLQKQIVELRTETIEQFDSLKRFSLIIAEGFLPYLPDREGLLKKMALLLAPGGMLVINFVDRSGSLIEMTRGLIFRRACELSNVEINSNAALDIASRLFSEDFSRINASRPFQAWIKDNFINPYFTSQWLWSYQEIIPIVEAAGCGFHSSSPGWSSLDKFSWYKNTNTVQERHKILLENWADMFLYHLTGLRSAGLFFQPASKNVIDAAVDFTNRVVDYSRVDTVSLGDLTYPHQLEQYLAGVNIPGIKEINMELKRLFEVVTFGSLDELVGVYQNSEHVRKLWGTPLHYMRVDKL